MHRHCGGKQNVSQQTATLVRANRELGAGHLAVKFAVSAFSS